MTTEPDPFDIPTEELLRDRWDRPLIKQSDGTLVPYTRASTFAGWLDDGVGLAIWKSRHVALSIATNEDLAGVVAGLSYGDKDLDVLIERALQRAKTDESANWGTAVHRFTEPDSPPTMPERFKSDVTAYHAEMDRRGWEVLDTEIFIVNDDLRVAGTFDHLIRTRDGRVMILDKKTGKLHYLSMAMQLACYAGGSRYDVTTGARTPIHPDIDQRAGVIAHIPAGQGRCQMIGLDINRAAYFAHVAITVNAMRRRERELAVDI
jgi:hypothetical protein